MQRLEVVRQLIATHSVVGFGFYSYVRLRCRRYSEPRIELGFLSALAKEAGISEDQATQIVETCVALELLAVDEEYLWPRDLLEQNEKKKAQQDFFRKKGREGAAKRWKKTERPPATISEAPSFWLSGGAGIDPNSHPNPPTTDPATSPQQPSNNQSTPTREGDR